MSLDRMRQMEIQLEPKLINGISKPFIYAIGVTPMDEQLQKDLSFLDKVNEFMAKKGIGFTMMYYLIIRYCNARIAKASEVSTIPFRFRRDESKRALEHQLRDVRAKFLAYAYQLKETNIIEDIIIQEPLVARVDKPETVYGPYEPISSVYASKPTNEDNETYTRDVVILPNDIKDLSPQPSPSTSVQAQETIEINQY